MAAETIESGSPSDRRLMQDLGFSEELKKQLEERIEQASFKAQTRPISSQVSNPAFAGKGTQEQAAPQPWVRAPRMSATVTGRAPSKKAVPVGQRLANARDKTSVYSTAQQTQMTDEQRERFRKELKERFTPGARPMPTTLSGLASLANERIEDAIARGQFKNLPRGKGKNIERDYTANSPFLDTTEYFMNKIIQKQDIVPPWIEKQQEVVKTVAAFRSRLRSDWRRHAARSIASRGGSLQEQLRKAQSFALAEERQNPKQTKVERLSEIESDGSLATVTVVEKPEVTAAKPGEAAAETTITVTESTPEDSPRAEDAGLRTPVDETPAAHLTERTTVFDESTRFVPTPTDNQARPPKSPPVLPMAYPFRDPQWEKVEHAYHTLAVNELNSLTRGYNLMAPKIAQRPYYSLPRELARCFADVAPTLADEIAQRARAPNVKIEIIGHRDGGLMDRFGTGHVAKVRDEDIQKKGYGFRQFWKDLFSKDEAVKA